MKKYILPFCGLGATVLLSHSVYSKIFHTTPLDRAGVMDLPSDDQYVKDRPRIQQLIKEMEALPFEPVEITSYDGLKLYGRYYHMKDNAPLRIHFHGYRSSALRDFCGGNKLARRLGHNTLVVDQRAHGNSQGDTISFGVKERYDCLNWAQYAAKRFGNDTPILLSGLSMGAATVLMASDLPLPSNVVGIVADCPYSAPEAIIKKVCKDVKIPPKLAYPFIFLGAKLFGDFSLSSHSALQSVKRTHIPILLIHGEDDRFVPCYMSEEIFKACASKKKLLTIPGAAHGMSYMKAPKTYEATLMKFMKECNFPFEEQTHFS